MKRLRNIFRIIKTPFGCVLTHIFTQRYKNNQYLYVLLETTIQS